MLTESDRAEVVRRVILRGVHANDAEDVAHVAILDALRRFKPERGASFKTFLYLATHSAVSKHFRKWNGRVGGSKMVSIEGLRGEDSAPFDVAALPGKEGRP